MASRNYIINIDDLTLTDKKEYKLRALAAGLERCGLKGIGDINADIAGLAAIPESNKSARVQAIYNFIVTGQWPRSIDQRELATGPALSDLVVATALDDWNTAALAAVGTAYSCFQAVAAPQLIVGKLVVFYGVSIETVPMPVSRLIFRRGGVAGNIQGQFDLEPLTGRLETDGFLSEPVIVDPNDVFAIQVLCRIATAVAARVHIHNFLFEGSGIVVA